MKIAVICFPGSQKTNLLDISRGLVKGMEAQGHQVDLINGEKTMDTRLTIYGYIAVGASAINLFGGKISDKVGKFIANSGIVAGKKAFAFTVKRGFRISRTLSVLMSIMEHEGMIIKFSDVVANSEEAEAIGKRLHIN